MSEVSSSICFGHRNRVAELLEIKRGNSLGSGQGHDLIVDESKEIFDRLQLSFNQLHRTLDILKRSHSPLQNFNVGLLNAPFTIVFGMFQPSARPASVGSARPGD